MFTKDTNMWIFKIITVATYILVTHLESMLRLPSTKIDVSSYDCCLEQIISPI